MGKMQDYITLVNNNIKNKKHVIITGNRGSGKTTLLGKILCETEIGKDIQGIVTFCEPRKAVYMRQLNTDNRITVGIFNPESTTKENRMHPTSDGFNKYGVEILEQLLLSEATWISIDEIGYLESKCLPYTEKLNRLFEMKRVIAVVRKQEIEFIKSILNREDVWVIDLDQNI